MTVWPPSGSWSGHRKNVNKSLVKSNKVALSCRKHQKLSVLWFLLMFCLHWGSGDNGASEYSWEKWAQHQRELSLKTEDKELEFESNPGVISCTDELFSLILHSAV